jgi:hypothetical protein
MVFMVAEVREGKGKLVGVKWSKIKRTAGESRHYLFAAKGWMVDRSSS